jgi:uncharacterized protein YdhG (YjbR/CyaY superfamily)
MLKMRERILRIIPDATEVVSYSMPAFKIDGEIVAGMLAAKHHVGYYPFSGKTLGSLQRELRSFSTTKSAVHVPVDRPLSVAMLRKLIAARRAEIVVDDWATLGLAAPARRALQSAGVNRLRDLTKLREGDLAALHGMGPNAVKSLRAAMKKQRISFKR